MGMSCMSSGSTNDGYVAKSPIEPNPKNFKIVKSIGLGDYCLVKINYPNCTNYEGMKICLYNYPLDKIAFTKSLDPHFSKLGIAPFARFEPTDKGWKVGLNLLKKLSKNSCQS